MHSERCFLRGRSGLPWKRHSGKRIVKKAHWSARCLCSVSCVFHCYCYEEESDVDGTAMETLRVYRPRLVLHGQSGTGQGYVGAALLHFLEGYHVQSLDLGTLMGDSTRVSKLTTAYMPRY